MVDVGGVFISWVWCLEGQRWRKTSAETLAKWGPVPTLEELVRMGFHSLSDAAESSEKH